jgi:hypothetical protein
MRFQRDSGVGVATEVHVRVWSHEIRMRLQQAGGPTRPTQHTSLRALRSTCNTPFALAACVCVCTGHVGHAATGLWGSRSSISRSTTEWETSTSGLYCMHVGRSISSAQLESRRESASPARTVCRRADTVRPAPARGQGTLHGSAGSPEGEEDGARQKHATSLHETCEPT